MTANELKFILEEGEGYKLEFKESLDKSLARELVAFANASGGRLFLGVTDNGKAKGIQVTNELKFRIQDISNNCEPQLLIKFQPYANVLILHVEEGNDKPYKCSEGFFLRMGPNSQKLNRNQIIDFLKHEGKTRYEELLYKGFDFKKHFDQEKLDRFLNLSGIKKHTDNKTILLNMGVASMQKTKLAMNNAGMLFFSKNTAFDYEQATITCVVFKGNERIDVVNRKDFGEDIISNIEDAIRFVTKELAVRYVMTGKAKREEHYELPLLAIREAIVNAVSHRDYFEKGAHTTIAIFDDRIEITNPGGLVKGIELKELGKKVVRRNPLIASLLYRAGYVENLGTGILKIRNLLKEGGNKTAEFEATVGFFTITFKRKKVNFEGINGGLNEGIDSGDGGLNGGIKNEDKIHIIENEATVINDGGINPGDGGISGGLNLLSEIKISKEVRQRLFLVLKLINETEGVQLNEITSKLNIATRTIERDLGFLRKHKIIERVGAKKTGGYKVIGE